MHLVAHVGLSVIRPVVMSQEVVAVIRRYAPHCGQALQTNSSEQCYQQVETVALCLMTHVVYLES